MNCIISNIRKSFNLFLKGRNMTRKYKVKKIKGVRVAEKIEGKKDRPLFPRAAVFKSKKAYDRNKEKQESRKAIWQ